MKMKMRLKEIIFIFKLNGGRYKSNYYPRSLFCAIS
jgi:hypothetical protein